MSGSVVVGIAIAFFVTAIVLMALWQMFATRRARAVLAREDQYRKLAEGFLDAEEDVRRQLASIAAHLTEIEGRLGSLERVLSTVE